MLENFITLPEKTVPEFNSSKRQLILDHKIMIINHPKTITHTVDSRYSYPEEFSLYAYLRLAGFDSSLFYPIMVINDLNSPMEFNTAIKELLIPDQELITLITNSLVEL